MVNTASLSNSVDPLLVFGGPYSNLEATRAMLAEAKRLGVPPERTVCTGDLVAYCASPVETIEHVRNSKIRVVMGNCDEQLANSAGDWGKSDPLAVPEFIQEMKRRGHSEAVIQKVVYDNPLSFFKQCRRWVG